MAGSRIRAPLPPPTRNRTIDVTTSIAAARARARMRATGRVCRGWAVGGGRGNSGRATFWPRRHDTISLSCMVVPACVVSCRTVSSRVVSCRVRGVILVGGLVWSSCRRLRVVVVVAVASSSQPSSRYHQRRPRNMVVPYMTTNTNTTRHVDGDGDQHCSMRR